MRISKNPVPVLFIIILVLLMGCDVFFSDLARKPDIDLDGSYSAFYAVTFDPNGGSGGIYTVEVMRGASVSSMPPEPFWPDGSRTFLEWQILDGDTFTGSSTVNSNMTVYAKWSTSVPVSGIMVIFDLNSGSGNFTLFQIMNDANENKASEPSPEPWRLGFEFTGWYYDDGTGETLWDFDNEITDNITLTANWLMREYTLFYHENNGDTDDEVPSNPVPYLNNNTILAYDNALLGFTPPTDHVFLNWNTVDPALSPSNPNPPGTRFYPGQALNILPGWGEELSDPISLYAHWRDASIVPETFTVSFNLNGGSLTPHPDAITGLLEDDVLDAALDKPVPARTGYTFKGWYTEPGGVNEWIFDNGIDTPTPVKEDTVLFAIWDIRSYHVVYNANGGSGTLPTGGTYKYDETVTISSPGSSPGDLSRDGYDFLYWNTEDPVNPSTIPPDPDPPGTRFFPGQSVVNLPGWDDDDKILGTPPLPTVTLYAQWAPKTYTVSFNSNLGTHVDAILNVAMTGEMNGSSMTSLPPLLHLQRP